MEIAKSSENSLNKMSNIYQNNLSYTTIRGLSMVSLVIDGKERVCLAQISNSLLKKFTYNEIHNRRVALGINCIQCTPLQLDILRSTGAMPVSSRRCGMITKREAERLVKSFLDDNKPLTLPENFAFDVQHKCGFGCRGIFFPSRYNSSRAKCIRCYYCFAFFSPNKFIFHMHETSNSKYVKPETANFNSWRRHISLINETNNEDLSSAWEDVKSIFNGGKRKRNQHSPVSSQFCDESDLDCSLNESSNEMNKPNKSTIGERNVESNIEKLNDEDEFDECEDNSNNNDEKQTNDTKSINTTNTTISLNNNTNNIATTTPTSTNTNKFELNEHLLKLPFLNPFFTASAAFNFTQLMPEIFGISNNSLLVGNNLNRTDSDLFRQKLFSNPLFANYYNNLNNLNNTLDINNKQQQQQQQLLLNNNNNKRFDYANICNNLFGNQSMNNLFEQAKSKINNSKETYSEENDENEREEEPQNNSNNNTNEDDNDLDEESNNDSKLHPQQQSAFRPPSHKKPKNFFSLVDHI